MTILEKTIATDAAIAQRAFEEIGEPSKLQKYVWATWLVSAHTNFIPYLTDVGDETINIHAFYNEGEDDGEGLHLTDTGAQLYCSPTVQNNLGGERLVRITLMIPTDEPYTVFSPSIIGDAEAEEWGIGTAEHIEDAITALETV